MSAFEIRGVVEGFYGVFYTAPERDDLLRFMGQQGFNFYLYAPKNDRQHRARWREAYPPRVVAQFKKSFEIAQANGIRFAYALSPVVSLCHACDEDFALITEKFQAFYEIGLRDFALCFDDIRPEFLHEVDRQRYQIYDEAHADLANRLYEWLAAKDCRLSICPTDYHGAAPFSAYIHELGALLHPEIDIFYTGREICSPSISTAEAKAFAEAVKRAPLIWDNYPVNDLAMKGELHLAPISGRDRDLQTVVKGILINPMIQAEATKIALFTYGEYLKDPEQYQAEASWERALLAIAGEESADALKLLAENSLYSCLDSTSPEKFDRLAEAVLGSLREGQAVQGNSAIGSLDAYINQLDEATYHLKFRMENLALRNNLLPWIELLEQYLWLGRRALLLLRNGADEGLMRMMNENIEDAQKYPKRIGGKSLLALADYVKDILAQKV